MSSNNDTDDDPKVLTGAHKELHDKYYAFLKRSGKSTTLQTRESCLRQWMIHCQERRVSPKTAEERDVREFVDRNLHKADTMIASLLSTVSVFYIWACNRDYCETNPAEDVSLDDTYYNHIDPKPHTRSRFSNDGAIRTMPLSPFRQRTYRRYLSIWGRQRYETNY